MKLKLMSNVKTWHLYVLPFSLVPLSIVCVHRYMAGSPILLPDLEKVSSLLLTHACLMYWHFQVIQ